MHRSSLRPTGNNTIITVRTDVIFDLTGLDVIAGVTGLDVIAGETGNLELNVLHLHISKQVENIEFL